MFHPLDEPPVDLNGDALARTGWLRERQRYLDVKQSMTEHLARQYPGAQIEIQRGEHRQPVYQSSSASEWTFAIRD